MPLIPRRRRPQRGSSPYRHLQKHLKHSYRTQMTSGKKQRTPLRSRRGPHRPQISLAERYSPRAASPTGPERYRSVSPPPEVISRKLSTPEVIWIKDVPAPRKIRTQPPQLTIPENTLPHMGNGCPVHLFTTSTREVRYITSPERDPTSNIPWERSHTTRKLGLPTR